MRKLVLALIITSLLPISLFAADEYVTVFTTEEIPGAQCICALTDNSVTDARDAQVGSNSKACGNPETRKYKCEVKKGMGAFQTMFAAIVRWVVYIIMLLGVLAIAAAGILWTMGSDSEEQTKKAKGWAKNIIVGLILLFTFRYILGFLAPWIFQ